MVTFLGVQMTAEIRCQEVQHCGVRKYNDTNTQLNSRPLLELVRAGHGCIIQYSWALYFLITLKVGHEYELLETRDTAREKKIMYTRALHYLLNTNFYTDSHDHWDIAQCVSKIKFIKILTDLC